MGDDRYVMKALGLFIFAVISAGGIGTIAVFSRIEKEQIDVAFVLGPIAVVTIVGMTILWAGVAVVTSLRSTSDQIE
ncbi:MAG: hypothetical protein WBM90_14385 [Acidimicrobiia bacterium]